MGMRHAGTLRSAPSCSCASLPTYPFLHCQSPTHPPIHPPSLLAHAQVWGQGIKLATVKLATVEST